jgi:hypothetical protein
MTPVMLVLVEGKIFRDALNISSKEDEPKAKCRDVVSMGIGVVSDGVITFV